MREEELVKCRGLPDDSGVQHGVLCSGVWWGLRPCFGRGYRVFEEDGLGPYPPAVCGRRVGVFSFDGSTAVYLRLRAAATRRLPPAHACGRSLFGAHQKENGGGLKRVTTRSHAPFGAAAPRHAESSCPTGGTGGQIVVPCGWFYLQ